MTDKKPGLDTAYDLKTPEDSARLYRDWAETYDSDFAARMDYQMPVRVATAFAAKGKGPVLDIGAGTGLVAVELSKLGVGPIDGIDISDEMLTVAATKGVYRRTIAADLTKPLPMASGSYDGFVSSGTFTHGHVGPVALDELLRIAAPGAFFALSVHSAVYDGAGFGKKFAQLEKQINELTIEAVPIYGAAATGDHRDDKALIVSFWRV